MAEEKVAIFTEKMAQFWASLKEAVAALNGSHYTEKVTLASGGQRRWPSYIQTATIHGTPSGDVKMRKVGCHGWRKDNA